jgi:hypothetical protein
MSAAEALRLAIVLTSELNALMLAYKKAREEGREDLSEEELATFQVRATDSGDRLQLKIDNL